MKKFKEKAFTLIELIAVLVIMAIIALIVTPLVMSIIRKTKVSADKRSIDAYGRSIELAIAGYLLDNGKFPTSIEQLTIEYSGNEVVCATTQLNSDSSVYLANCTADYVSSEIKYVVDAWKTAQAPDASEARLIQYEEFENLGYEMAMVNPSTEGFVKTENTPSWVYNSNYWYCTMSPLNDSSSVVWIVNNDGSLGYRAVSSYDYVVRPVITISKSAL